MSGNTRAAPRKWRITQFSIVFLVSVLGLVAGCGDDNGKKSRNTVPVLTSVSPTTAVAGGPEFTLTATGTGFVTGSVVRWNGAGRSTTFVSATQVKAAITAADVANPFSVPPDGSPPNGPSLNGGMGIFERVVIFASKASNLVPGDTNDAWDVFLRDTCIEVSSDPVPGCTPTTTRISLAPDGSQSNGDSGATATSPNGPVVVSFSGRCAAFVSSATNLVTGDTNGVDDVFVVDTCRDTWGRPLAGCTIITTRISLRNDGSQSNAPAREPAIGDDGGHVVFVSADPDIVAGDANGVADVFLRDSCLSSTSGRTPGTRRISVAPGNTDANGASGSPSFTGRYVAFTSAATNLVADDMNGLVDVFMRDTCIGADTSCTPSTERISLGNGNAQADGASSEPLVTLPMGSMSGYDYHGRFVVFVSTAANLVADDTNDVADVFMRGVCHDTTTCVTTTTRLSVGEGGVEGDGPSVQPRGNYDPWAGPSWATFLSEATNFWPGAVPDPYFGAIFMTTTY
jgi:hypothetical protein